VKKGSMDKEKKNKEKADQLGQQYEDTNGAIKDLNKSKENTADEIKEFASVEGETSGKQTLVYGDKFAVGYVTTDPGQVIDEKKLFRLRPDLYKTLTKRVLDEDRLAQAVKDGTLKRKTLAKCFIPSSKEPQKRVHVVNLHEDKKGKKKK
jgi:hypothetical protein